MRLILTFDLIYFENRNSNINSSNTFRIRLLELNKTICNKIGFYTVKQDISADTLFSRLGDFAVPRILIFADAGTEHSSFIVLLLYFSFFH